MKRKTNIVGCLVLFSVLLLLLVSNAHAYIVTTELGSFNIQLVPETPDSNMSIEWNLDSPQKTRAYASASYRTVTGENSAYRDTVKLDPVEETSATVAATTEHSNMTVGIRDNEGSITADLSEDKSIFTHCEGNWSSTSSFTVHGDGRVLISAVYNTDFENDDSFDLDFYASGRLEIGNMSSGTYLWDSDYFDEDSTVSTINLEAEIFFNDGDSGQLFVSQYSDFDANSEAVPIPGAVWLFSSGLFGLGALRKGRR